MHMGRATLTDDYLNVEVLLNNIKKVSINNGTEYALAVAQVDSSGNATGPGTAIVSGTKTVTTAGTAVQVTATPTTIKGVWVSADFLAGIPVVVGDASVVGNVSGLKGAVLMPGNPPIFLDITDLSLLWVDSQTNGGKLSYLYQT